MDRLVVMVATESTMIWICLSAVILMMLIIVALISCIWILRRLRCRMCPIPKCIIASQQEARTPNED